MKKVAPIKSKLLLENLLNGVGSFKIDYKSFKSMFLCNRPLKFNLNSCLTDSDSSVVK